jgi:uncharacterized protein
LIIIDTGYLLALLDRRDAWHARAYELRHTADEGWITTSPVLTECAHLLQRALGPEFAAALFDDLAAGGLHVWDIPPAGQAQIPKLMRKYAQLPMDLADASLVLLAEHLGHGRVLSTDMRDFGACRWKNRKPFKNLMETA